jgi:predicted esterase
VNKFKHCIESRLLGRSAHADVFELGASSQRLFLLFGGSGVDDEEYIARSKTLSPVFDPVLNGLSDCPLTFIHISAPYDVPFNRFDKDRAALETWNAHVLTELLELWAALPFYLCSFSGGAALALNGIHQEPRCLGAAALGADAIPQNFECPKHWEQPLLLFCGPADSVCNHPTNQQQYDSLVSRGQAVLTSLQHGGHRLADYATEECLGSLLRSQFNLPNS